MARKKQQILVNSVDGLIELELAEQEYKLCSNCGVYHKHVTITSNGEHFCDTCLVPTHKCVECGCFDEVGSGKHIDGDYFCADCLDRHETYCFVCGETLSTNDVISFEGKSYCRKCAERLERVHNYSYKPSPIFAGDGNRYFGVEIETEGAESSVFASEIIGDNKRFYAKHDGSLSNGIEFVSHPTSLKVWRETSSLKDFCSNATDCGFKSHQTSSCGLHIHVSKESVKREVFEKVLVFFNNNWGDIVKFTRRNTSKINRWAANNLAGVRFANRPESEKIKIVKDYRGDSRYVAINSTEYTYEFRIFRGTLKASTVLASIEFCNIVLDYCNEHNFTEVDGSTFKDLYDYANGKEEYTEFTAYVVERGILGGE